MIYNIICDIMDKNKLRKLKKELELLRSRKTNIRPREMINFAKKLGRVKSNRGKEPNYINQIFPLLRPISIPNHPGSLYKFTAGNILDSLEEDIFTHEEELRKQND